MHGFFMTFAQASLAIICLLAVGTVWNLVAKYFYNK